jgi:hypothetical protein
MLDVEISLSKMFEKLYLKYWIEMLVNDARCGAVEVEVGKASPRFDRGRSGSHMASMR